MKTKAKKQKVELEKNNWFLTAAGKVSTSLLAVSFVLLLFACINNKSNNIDSIFIGLATNLLGIIITVSFVQFFIDKQDKEEEKRDEIEKIQRYHKVMVLLIDRYTLFFQCLTSTNEERTKYVGRKDLLRDFSFSDMADLYKFSRVLSVELLRPTIELFYDAEQELRNYMIEMLKNIDFKYNKPIESLLIEFIKKSKEMDVSGVIINNQKILFDNEKSVDTISQYIKDEDNYNWVQKYKQGQLSGNVMTPYVTLFFLLKNEGKIIMEYQQLINSL